MSTSYRWVIVAVGALMTCVAIGAMFSLAVFLEPMSTATGWSRAGISSAMTLNFLVMGLGAFGWGAVSDRFGTRIVVLIGAVLLGLALSLASRAHVAHPIPAHLRHPCRPCRQRLLRAHDRRDHGVVRGQPQPCGLAGLRRHGRGADDDLAVRALADLDLRLAHRDVGHRHPRLGPAASGRAAGSPAARRRQGRRRNRAAPPMAQACRSRRRSARRNSWFSG